MKASELKKGAVVVIDGQNYLTREVVVKSPSSRSGNTLYKVLFRNVVTKQKFEQTYKSDDFVQEVEFARRPVQLLYKSMGTEFNSVPIPVSCTFMDNETFEQFTLDDETLEAELPYLVDGIEGLYALIADDVVLAVELPPTVEMEIVECAPSIKGASATARSKPATLSTGLVVQVPEYLAQNERIRINTTTGEFMARA